MSVDAVEIELAAQERNGAKTNFRFSRIRSLNEFRLVILQIPIPNRLKLIEECIKTKQDTDLSTFYPTQCPNICRICMMRDNLFKV